MPHFQRRPDAVIDYFSRGGDRKRLTIYLRNGNFKKIAGAKEYGPEVRKRRIVFCCIASLLLLTGLFFILF